MPNGGETGTSGPPQADGANGVWARLAAHPMTAIAIAGFFLGVVNATSDIIEARRLGLAFSPAAQFVNEYSSVAIILALAPLIGMAVARWPPRAETWPRALLIHLALTIPFSVVHVAGIWAVRAVVYGALGVRYDFAGDGLGLVFLYEYRKDVVTYATIAAVFWFYQLYAERQAAKVPVGPDRIEIRDGGAAFFLAPQDILWIEAAGNYVEFHTAARTHLVRGTLAAWETRLAERGFVRVHRARLVNRARIAAVRPTPAGDVEITLEGGALVGGSRRYRAALDAKA